MVSTTACSHAIVNGSDPSVSEARCGPPVVDFRGFVCVFAVGQCLLVDELNTAGNGVLPNSPLVVWRNVVWQWEKLRDMGR